MLFARISTEIMLFPGHMGGEKPTQSGNEDLSTEISDDTLLKCQGLWLEFTAVVHYTLVIGHLLSETACLSSLPVSLTPTRKHLTLPTSSNIHYVRSLIGNSSWSAYHFLQLYSLR